jgi:hypothetical protein
MKITIRSRSERYSAAITGSSGLPRFLQLVKAALANQTPLHLRPDRHQLTPLFARDSSLLGEQAIHTRSGNAGPACDRRGSELFLLTQAEASPARISPQCCG